MKLTLPETKVQNLNKGQRLLLTGGKYVLMPVKRVYANAAKGEDGYKNTKVSIGMTFPSSVTGLAPTERAYYLATVNRNSTIPLQVVDTNGEYPECDTFVFAKDKLSRKVMKAAGDLARGLAKYAAEYDVEEATIKQIFEHVLWPMYQAYKDCEPANVNGDDNSETVAGGAQEATT